MRRALFVLAAVGFGISRAANDAASPLGPPVLEGATMQCVGIHWLIGGDQNQNAVARVEWRKRGEGRWTPASPLVRVERGAHLNETGKSSLDVPASTWLFAGSVVSLAAATDYELRVSLEDPDGGAAEQSLTTRTLPEPAAPPDAVVKHVVPGGGGGSGSEADPFRGLAAATAGAQPGDLFLVGPGTYAGGFEVKGNGTPARPIIWRGSRRGETILDGESVSGKRAARVVNANDTHDVWFEGLTIRNAQWGLTGNESARIVVRRCRISGVDYGIAGMRNEHDTIRGWFIADNLIEGPSTWPRTKGIESARGIQLSGEGHVVCHNRIRGFADAIDTFPSQRCTNIDFHHNDISEMTDDGIELDFAERNVRCFSNRLTNVFQGISLQPVFGGPVYIFRNVMYNVVGEPFKMHNSPSGAHLYHNTSVKHGIPFLLSTTDPVRHCRSRNNLFVGTQAPYACEMGAPMKMCDFDHDGFAGGPWNQFLKWNGMRYATFAEMRAKAPVYRHAILLEDAHAFAAGIEAPAEPATIHHAPDLRPRPGCAAIDAGEMLPGFNDLFHGNAPDLGAYEAGSELPIYGPRPFAVPTSAPLQPQK